MNPLINNYTAKKPQVAVKSVIGNLASRINPQDYPVIMSNPRQTSFNTSATTTEISHPAPPTPPTPPTPAPVHVPPPPSPAPSHPPAHFHPSPPMHPPHPSHPIAHAHTSPFDPKPAPPAGFPHMHSGHPYIAPAVAPQRMTYQQLVEYLANTNGTNLSTVLSNGSKNFLAKCKSYCDTLPASPVCDDTNVLYRNACEAKCVNKKVSKMNLRYGRCCCSADDFDYEFKSNSYDHLLVGQGAETNFCISTCIYNCLGREIKIEEEHDDDIDGFELTASYQCRVLN